MTHGTPLNGMTVYMLLLPTEKPILPSGRYSIGSGGFLAMAKKIKPKEAKKAQKAKGVRKAQGSRKAQGPKKARKSE
jgi:hypothetical protein